jgi:hypothetical protein
MEPIRLTILLLLITTISRGQESDFELKNIKFKGLEFTTTKEIIIKSFGQGRKVETNYECGFFTNDQDGGPYYQLVYADFNYIGSDKEKFYLEHVNFDIKGKIKIYYQDKELSGQTTKDDFIKIFGDKIKQQFEKYQEKDSILMRSTGGDDGVIFTFKNGRLHKFEYWTPC